MSDQDYNSWYEKMMKCLIRVAKNGDFYDRRNIESFVRAIQRESYSKKWSRDIINSAECLMSAGFLAIESGDINDSSTWVNISLSHPLDEGEITQLKDNYRNLLADYSSVSATLASRNAELEQAKEAFKKAIKLAEESKPAILKVLVTHSDQKGKVVKKDTLEGVFHREFPTLVDLAKMRMNLFIYGPTGVGKTYTCQQLAKTLGLRFGYVSCTNGMSESQLTGRLLPTGNRGTFEYSTTEFVECYENGGLFLLDELDAADPNVLLVVNSALSNDTLTLPNRVKKPYAQRHPDFVCVAAANTIGIGADRLYSSRNKLDMATLDRFQIGKVRLDYDPRVDEYLCPEESLRKRLQAYRRGVLEHALERAVSTRFVKDAYRMYSSANWTFDRIDAALFQGWREDEINRVKPYATLVSPSGATAY